MHFALSHRCWSESAQAGVGPAYPRRASRKWYLYGFYLPEMVEKTRVICRTYFNFIAKGQDGKMPAMRIGLAKGAICFEDVLYFI